MEAGGIKHLPADNSTVINSESEVSAISSILSEPNEGPLIPSLKNKGGHVKL